MEYQTLTDACSATIEHFKGLSFIDNERFKPQEKILYSIAKAYDDGKKTVILEAPTGSGKSIIAFAVSHMFSIFNELKECSGYICTSSKILQDQYTNDIKRFNLGGEYTSLKGQSNYMCNEDNVTFDKRTKCKKYSLGKLAEGRLECGLKCEYIQTRKRAINGVMSVFNYSYWLTQMNTVFDKNEFAAAFAPRPVTIFDEAHLIQNIVQNQFALKFNFQDIVKEAYGNYIFMFNTYGRSLMHGNIITKTDLANFQTDAQNLINTKVKQIHTISKLHDKTKIDHENALKTLNEISVFITNLLNKFRPVVDKQFPKDEALYTDAQEKFMLWYSGMYDFIDHVNITHDFFAEDVNRMVLTEEKTERKGREIKNLMFRTTNVAELIKRHILKFTDFSIMMSATIGGIDTFAETHGITNYAKINIDTNFDFSKSPLYNIIPKISMSYRNKQESMPKMLECVDMILEKHKNENGVIHTANYEIFNEIKDHYGFYSEVGARLLFCSTAYEKRENVKALETGKNFVIVGPGLIEGIDLKDDMARFAIHVKVPFASLGDELVRRKIDEDNKWYGWDTFNKILQAVGRCNRHKDDYAINYFLDSEFGKFFARYGYKNIPKHFKDRFDEIILDENYKSDSDILDDFLNNFDINNLKLNEPTISKNETKLELQTEPKSDPFQALNFDSVCDNTDDDDLPF